MKKFIVVILSFTLFFDAHAANGVKKMETAESLTMALVIKHESFKSNTYLCPANKLTIGYGFTDEALVKKGTITRSEADKILAKRVAEEVAWVKKTFPKLKSEKHVAAIADLAYNVGHDTLCWKTVNGKRVHTNAYTYLAAGNIQKAIPEILEFRCAGGKVLRGLVKRRADEKAYLLA